MIRNVNLTLCKVRCTFRCDANFISSMSELNKMFKNQRWYGEWFSVYLSKDWLSDGVTFSLYLTYIRKQFPFHGHTSCDLKYMCFINPRKHCKFMWQKIGNFIWVLVASPFFCFLMMVFPETLMKGEVELSCSCCNLGSPSPTGSSAILFLATAIYALWHWFLLPIFVSCHSAEKVARLKSESW